MNIEEAVAHLGLEKCEFEDECDFCESPSGPSYVSLSHIPEDVTETNFYICSACAIRLTTESKADYARIEELESTGHSSHCACRQVWGDGECECSLREGT